MVLYIILIILFIFIGLYPIIGLTMIYFRSDDEVSARIADNILKKLEKEYGDGHGNIDIDLTPKKTESSDSDSHVRYIR